MTECIRCKSSKTRKHGFGRHATQRYFCNGCHASFTLEGVRGTYRPEFKQAVVEAYCHQKLKAQTVVHDF